MTLFHEIADDLEGNREYICLISRVGDELGRMRYI